MKRRFSIGFLKATSACLTSNGLKSVRCACSIHFALALFAVATAVCGQELDRPAETYAVLRPGRP